MEKEKYKRFLPIAQAFASMSKDDSTKVGAIILGREFEVRSSGWNGAPRGSKADEDERRHRPEKYSWYSHAEMNAIAQAAKAGTAIDGCSMVITHAPCMICARLIVSSGIRQVFFPKPESDFLDRWGGEFSKSLILFEECGISVETL